MVAGCNVVVGNEGLEILEKELGVEWCTYQSGGSNGYDVYRLVVWVVRILLM